MIYIYIKKKKHRDLSWLFHWSINTSLCCAKDPAYRCTDMYRYVQCIILSQ